MQGLFKQSCAVRAPRGQLREAPAHSATVHNNSRLHTALGRSQATRISLQVWLQSQYCVPYIITSQQRPQPKLHQEVLLPTRRAQLAQELDVARKPKRERVPLSRVVLLVQRAKRAIRNVDVARWGGAEREGRRFREGPVEERAERTSRGRREVCCCPGGCAAVWPTSLEREVNETNYTLPIHADSPSHHPHQAQTPLTPLCPPSLQTAHPLSSKSS